jgi:hypothetical protein
MKKRVFMIHGWGGQPDVGWMLWLKKELEKKGFEVIAPQMPNTEKPKIEEWVGFLEQKVDEPDENTYFVGHSIGCQTILRYLEKLPENKKVGGALFVAGWFNLKPEATEDGEDAEIAKPWIETPIDCKKVLTHTKKFIAIFSDNDPFAPVEDSELFKKRLGAKIIIEHNKGHFTGENNVFELPVGLEELVKITDHQSYGGG